MIVAMLGCGKLGLPVATTIALKGHQVYGYDSDEGKREKYRRGVPDTGSYEPNLSGQLHEVLRSGNLVLCDSLEDIWLNKPEIIFVAVPTPSKKDNSFDTSYVESILCSLNDMPKILDYHPVIAVISTVLPMTTRAQFAPLVEGYEMVYNPFFIAMSTVIQDYLEPEFVLLGYDNPQDSDAMDTMIRFYSSIYEDEKEQPPLLHMTWENAEATKMLYNTIIGAKIIIANTIMEICHNIPHADCDVVVDAFEYATKRIIGSKYLRGGMPDAGLCVKPGSKVFTDKGYIPIEEINVGDNVLGHDGKYHAVTKTFSREYNGEMISITPTGFSNYSITVTPEHPIFCGKRKFVGKRFYHVAQEGNRNPKKFSSFIGFNNYEFIPAHMIERGDGICLPAFDENNYPIKSLPLNVSEYDMRRKTNQLPSEIPINEETMYLFGWYLAEGSGDERRLGFALHHNEEKYADELSNILKNHFGVSSSKSFRDHHNLVLRLSSRPVNRFFKSTFGENAWTKKIPWNWLKLEQKLLEALIRGLWYGDGGCYKGEYYIQITSEQIHKFIQACLLKFKIPFRIKEYEKRVGGDGTPHRKSYWIGVKHGYGLENILTDFPFEYKENKRIIWFENNIMKYSVRKIKKEQYLGLVYNLEVKETNSYVLESGIVHNCHPRDQRALDYLCKKLDLSSNIFEFIMNARELQTGWLAYLLWKAELPAVVLGKRFKAGSSLTDDSGSILVHDIASSLGVEVHYHDPMLSLEYYPSMPHVFLVAINEPWTRNYPYPSGSVVLDVWRQFDQVEIEMLGVRGVKYIPIGRNQP